MFLGAYIYLSCNCFKNEEQNLSQFIMWLGPQVGKKFSERSALYFKF